jgi:hypothetical protein
MEHREICHQQSRPSDQKNPGNQQPSLVAQIPENRRKSHLLSLPPELRNTIWQHVVSDPYPIFLSSSEPGLFLACKQTRHETRTMYYNSNSFEIWYPPSKLSSIGFWNGCELFFLSGWWNWRTLHLIFRGYWYAFKRFVTPGHILAFKRSLQWLDGIGPEAREEISRLEIRVRNDVGTPSPFH